MTVLPSAPIDSATGLPVPTIAVATDGGTSIIKDDGTVVDLVGDSYGHGLIKFLGGEKIYIGARNIGPNGTCLYGVFVESIPAGDIVLNTENVNNVIITSDTAGGYIYTDVYNYYPFNRYSDGDGSSNDIVQTEYGTAVSTTAGVAKIISEGILTDITNSGLSSALISADYNTGWMPGDIKLATLSQKYTDGLDLITNGHFDTDTSGWTAVGGAVLSTVSDRLRLESNGPASPYAYQQITTVIGETYKVTYDGYYDTVNYKLSVGTTQGGTELTDTAGGFAVDTHTTLTFAATSTTTYISLYLLGAGEFSYADFDNISVSLSSEIFGEELVTNGTFDTDVSGWTDISIGTGSVSWNASGYVDLTSVDGSNSGWITQSFDTVIGKTYVASITRIANKSILQIGISSGNNNIYQSENISTTDETVTFVATVSTTYVSILNFSYTGTSQVDNVSVRLAEPDRSVNNKGLQRFDTIQKVPLLPGSDLVSFNFDQGYLLQPYNPDLNFGTGNFSIIGWAKLNEDAAYADLLYRSEGTGNNQFGVFVRGPSGVGGQENCLGFYMTDSGGSSLQSNPPNVIQVASWFQYCVVRTGSDVKVYINSKLVDTTTMATDHTSTTATLLIGGISDPDVEQSLLRISTTAPSAEQISKIYENEKFLFQENAKATLYGTSSDVTALAYDDAKNLLHVGTSSGRSVFQGLRRVDNTTDPVTAAISAVNGLVTEE